VARRPLKICPATGSDRRKPGPCGTNCRGDGLAVMEPIAFVARQKTDAIFMVERSINGIVARGAYCRASFMITHQDVDSSSLPSPG
jgi:hypothetical protein